MDYFEWLTDSYPASETLFDKMQKQLILLFEESKRDKWIINKIFELSNQLYVRNIELNDFLVKVNETFDKADEIFKEE